MLNCPYCKIEVGGSHKKCPLCQSRLVGEAEPIYFPKPELLKLQSFFYKIQLFIAWIIIITSLGLDYLFGLPLYPGCNYHWSLLILMWLLAFEYTIIRLFKKGVSASRILSVSVIITMIMLGITAYYAGFLWIVVSWVFPNVLMATMLANFVLSMVDKSGNAMAYLLTNLLMGILPYIVFYFMQRNCPVEWIVCLIVSFILFVGAIIFRGREVANELQRRFSV